MKKIYKSLGALALTGVFTMAAGCETMPDKLIWKNEDADRTAAKRRGEKGEEISPSGLENGPVSPITPEAAKKTALSRPKVVKTQELGEGRGAGPSYYDVVDEKPKESLAPVIDENARPIRIVTYDNNAVQKDYSIAFGVAWERVIESLLEIPLNTVDRSSGIITTDWLYDEKGDQGMLSLNPLGSLDNKIRYKYTVRVLDRGAMTRIKVTPFAQVISGRQWTPAKPGIVITERMFERIDRELAVPLPGERF